ncbi:MAG: Single-stranded DNA-binding protein [Parcubacteria group bacterium ADurb.Bin247]|jgi:single-strand DNA-binding protein|nr:MAG: Single-stranded DNA-binding protein [Parcubacteria group bacterium ADurb.Bin247]HQB84882.1 single-stranded DNA-binding protein [Candidatus Pacearchaeota archaeon]
MNLNKAILVGRLTKDPELRALPSGQNVASFGMATNRYFSDKSGQKQEATEFHNIVLFGRLADVASQYLKKGSMVLIEGRIQTRSWQDNEGNKKYKTEIVGESIQLGPKNTQMPDTTNQLNKEEIPIIQKEEEDIDIKDIPF